MQNVLFRTDCLLIDYPAKTYFEKYNQVCIAWRDRLLYILAVYLCLLTRLLNISIGRGQRQEILERIGKKLFGIIINHPLLK